MFNSQHPTCFTAFNRPIEEITLPKKFTYPFYYQPHPLAQMACNELKQSLNTVHPLHKNISGKMYGVLVVKNNMGDIGYLSAFSGGHSRLPHSSLTDNNHNVLFVPPVFNNQHDDNNFTKLQTKINAINKDILDLERSPVFISLQTLEASEQSAAKFQITQLQYQLVKNRKQRKAKRRWLNDTNNQHLLSQEQIKTTSIQLARESVQDKKAIAALKTYWHERMNKAICSLSLYTTQISQLKKTRKKLSNSLQKRLFTQYHLLNNKGEQKDLITLFKNTITPIPPSGAGDCAAPKLLQYAFKHQLTPICMAEFWWGNQPKSEIRKHEHFYPACQGKCQPILTHMLDGLPLEDNPLLVNPAVNSSLEIVYQDEHLVVVNKPENLLSVPGKHITDSASLRIKQQFPHATGPLILHRLDMATSGLMVFSLNQRAHKHLQQQFIDKKITKRYIAVIEGQLSEQEGEISLPLTLDINDRPRQKVCMSSGKAAHTKWQIIAQTENTTRLYLYPITGRTHQLRVHCSHPNGLNMPIKGDGLYGTTSTRLHLHAQQLSFIHPISNKKLLFEVAPNF